MFVKNYYLSLLLIILLYFINAVHLRENSENSLKLLHIIFRHGDRTNDVRTIYPKDPYKYENYHPYGLGQLTNDGKRQMYKLGQRFREIYGNFLGDYYFSKNVYSRCSTYGRTKTSLMLVMAGLYPPKIDQIWSNDLIWQPIMFDYQLIIHDMEYFGILCPNYRNHYKMLYENEEHVRYIQKHKFLFEYLTNHTGWNVTTLEKVNYINVGLGIEERWGFQLPNWTQIVWPNMIKEANQDYHYEATNNKHLTKYAIGFLLRKIINDTQNKIDGLTPNSKLYIYSGHDYNLAFLLRVIGVLNLSLEPTYASFVAIELHNINGTYFLKFFYENYTNDKKYLKIPNCGLLCSFDTFKKIMNDYLPTKDDKCGNEHLIGNINEKL